MVTFSGKVNIIFQELQSYLLRT